MSRLLLVRRWGSGTTHLASVPPEVVFETTILGASCEAIFTPVVTLCRRVLRAKGSGRAGDTIIVMQPDQLTCRMCSLLTGQPTHAEQRKAFVAMDGAMT